MIAIPVKTNRENPAIAPLFGKAKWFAFVNNEKITIEQNKCDGGRAVVEWLIDKGVDKLVIQEMGINPYQKVKEAGNIEVYHSGFERSPIAEAIEKLNNNALKILNEDSMKSIIAHHESRHTHNHDEHHHHDNH